MVTSLIAIHEVRGYRGGFSIAVYYWNL